LFTDIYVGLSQAKKCFTGFVKWQTSDTLPQRRSSFLKKVAYLTCSVTDKENSTTDTRTAR
jgi:hypothetical protein